MKKLLLYFGAVNYVGIIIVALILSPKFVSMEGLFFLAAASVIAILLSIAIKEA